MPQSWTPAMPKLLRRSALFLGGIALLAVLVALISRLTWQEHQRRLQVLRSGPVVAAGVSSSGYSPGRKCVVTYVYAWEGRAYAGRTTNCNAVARYRQGGTMPVRIDRNRPGDALAEGESAWPDYAVFLVLFGPFVLVLIVGVMRDLLRDIFARRRWNRRGQ